MKVKLISYSPEAENLIGMAGKICHTNKDFSSSNEILNEKMIEIAFNSHHYSLLEHISLTFMISEVSRALTHQLVRHRLCTFHELSQRSVSPDDLMNQVVIPDSIKENEMTTLTFKRTIARISDAYNYLINQGIPKEDARALLPNATMTQIMMTTNLRNLIHIMNLRLCNKAWKPIRELFEEIYKVCLDKFPSIFIHVGPSCVMNGNCPEGQFSCHQFHKVKERYKEMRSKYDFQDSRDDSGVDS